MEQMRVRVFNLEETVKEMQADKKATEAANARRVQEIITDMSKKLRDSEAATLELQQQQQLLQQQQQQAVVLAAASVQTSAQVIEKWEWQDTGDEPLHKDVWTLAKLPVSKKVKTKTLLPLSPPTSFVHHFIMRRSTKTSSYRRTRIPTMLSMLR